MKIQQQVRELASDLKAKNEAAAGLPPHAITMPTVLPVHSPAKKTKNKRVQTDARPAWPEAEEQKSTKETRDCNRRVDILSDRVGYLYKRLREHRQNLVDVREGMEGRIVELEGVVRNMMRQRHRGNCSPTLNVVNNIKS